MKGSASRRRKYKLSRMSKTPPTNGNDQFIMIREASGAAAPEEKSAGSLRQVTIHGVATDFAPTRTDSFVFIEADACGTSFRRRTKFQNLYGAGTSLERVNARPEKNTLQSRSQA